MALGNTTNYITVCAGWGGKLVLTTVFRVVLLTRHLIFFFLCFALNT